MFLWVFCCVCLCGCFVGVLCVFLCGCFVGVLCVFCLGVSGVPGPRATIIRLVGSEIGLLCALGHDWAGGSPRRLGCDPPMGWAALASCPLCVSSYPLVAVVFVVVCHVSHVFCRIRCVFCRICHFFVILVRCSVFVWVFCHIRSCFVVHVGFFVFFLVFHFN